MGEVLLNHGFHGWARMGRGAWLSCISCISWFGRLGEGGGGRRDRGMALGLRPGTGAVPGTAPGTGRAAW